MLTKAGLAQLANLRNGSITGTSSNSITIWVYRKPFVSWPPVEAEAECQFGERDEDENLPGIPLASPCRMPWLEGQVAHNYQERNQVGYDNEIYG